MARLAALLRLPHLEDDLVAAADAASVLAICGVGQPEKALEAHDALVLRIAALGEHGLLLLGVIGIAANSADALGLKRKTSEHACKK